MTHSPADAWQAEPYRLLFPLSMALGALSILLWTARLAGLPAPEISPLDHGLLMLPGAFGTAVLGFLGTAWPKQNGGEPWGLSVTVVLGLVQLLLCLGLLVGGLPARLGLALAALAWAGVALWSGALALPALRKKWDPTPAAGPLALLAAAAGLGLAAAQWGTLAALPLILHAGLIPLALALLDRLLPFFSGRVHPGGAFVRRPGFGLPLVLLGLGRALVSLDPGADLACGLLDLGLMGLILRQWSGWGPTVGWRPPLLGVLHLGIAWIGLGYGLDAARCLLWPLDPGALRHLWTVGGLGTLVAGISIRVTRGHGGLPLALGRAGGAVVLLIQLATLTRGLLPLTGLPQTALYPVSGLVLAASMLLWLGALGPAVRPR